MPTDDVEMTVQHRPVPPTPDHDASRSASTNAPSPAATPDEGTQDGSPSDRLDEDDDPSDRLNEDQTRSIDATLARFSAVHDQIAAEEDARRKKFWFFGKRKEPELGRDMPFDFRQGDDTQASRLEWKKERRKRRVSMLLKALAVAAVLTAVVAVGIGWSATAWGTSQDVPALDPGAAAMKDIGVHNGSSLSGEPGEDLTT